MQFNETNSTEETREIRNRLWESGDENLVPLAHNLTDEQIRLLREAFEAEALVGLDWSHEIEADERKIGA